MTYHNGHAMLVSCVFLITGCAGEPTPAELAEVVRSVDSATSAFLAAERMRDVDRLLEHIAPDFFMYQDGQRVGHAAVTEQIRGTMPSIQVFETEWAPMDFIALGRNHGIATFRFRDSIIQEDGTLFQAQGPTTLVWQKQGVHWLLIFADADHYPVAPR